MMTTIMIIMMRDLERLKRIVKEGESYIILGFKGK